MRKNKRENNFTEEDKVNCPFYFKNGGCRYGVQCTRRHLKPNQSSTLMFANLYSNTPITIAIIEGKNVPEEKIVESLRDYEIFYQDIFMELCKYGEIEEIQGLDNLGDHMIGNIYVRFNNEDDSTNCKNNVVGRYFGKKLIIPQFSPVSNFKDGKCKQFEESQCKRGSHCNFMHLKIIDQNIIKNCKKYMYNNHPKYLERKRKEREVSRSNSNKRYDNRNRSKDRKYRRNNSRSNSYKKSRRYHNSRSRSKDKYTSKYDKNRGSRKYKHDDRSPEYKNKYMSNYSRYPNNTYDKNKRYKNRSNSSSRSNNRNKYNNYYRKRSYSKEYNYKKRSYSKEYKYKKRSYRYD